MRNHKKDFSSRRGLLRKVGQRRRLLRFLEKDNLESFENLVKKLRLKKVEEPILEENLKDEEESTED